VLKLLSEIKERIKRLESYKPIRIGEVVAVCPEKSSVRVKFKEQDREVSYELPVLQKRVFKDKFYVMPEVGELVVCEFVNETDGFVLGSFYHAQNNPPENKKEKFVLTFQDGTKIEYDKDAHLLKVDIPDGEVHLSVQGGSGNVYINGNLIVSGQIYDLSKTKGSLDDFRNVYNSHTHPGDSGGTTGTPNQKAGV